MMDFLKVHLLVEENRFEAVSECSRQFKTQKSYKKEIEDILLSGRCMTPGGSGDQHAKNRKRLFSKYFFDTKKTYLFQNFFFQSKDLLLYFKNPKFHENPITLRETAHDTIRRPPPEPEPQISTFIILE